MALSLALQVHADATMMVVEARTEGRPHTPAETCETGVPSQAACRTVLELRSRPGVVAAQEVDTPKKLLRLKGEIECTDAEQNGDRVRRRRC
jgi:hypothetical protein